MYHHPGEYVTDFCIVKRGELYHLFHIRGERWTWPLGYKELDLGHATSTDLRLWTPHKPVLPAGPAGAWDESGNWAPDIFEQDGVYYCYYTGSDVNNNQAIGLATSTDLFTWNKHPDNPVVVPGPWSDRHVGKDVAGRDAMVFHDAERSRYLLYYTATLADGRACLGLSASTDLVHWQDLGPTYIEDDRGYNRLESAYLVQHGGKYYLFYSAKGGPKSKGHSPAAFAHFDIVYLVSDRPDGGWMKPANHELLTEWTCASEHPTFDGVTYMFYIVQEEVDGIWGASVLSDPKRIVWLPDGTVRVCECLPANVQKAPLFQNNRDSYAGWVEQTGEGQTVWNRWEITGSTGQVVQSKAEVANGQAAVKGDVFLMNTLWGEDLAFEAEILAEAGSIASLIVRGNPTALAGYRISLDMERQVVGMYVRFPNREDALIQERKAIIQPGQWHTLKAVAQGAFFDVYLDSALLIVRHHRLYTDGCFGLHARGAAQFRNVQAYRYIGPEGARADWQQHLRPRHLFPQG